MKKFKLEEIANFISGEIHYKQDLTINGLNDLKNAEKGQITFIGNSKFKKYWEESKASAAIVNDCIKIDTSDKPIIFVKDADIAMGKLLEVFSPKNVPVFDQDIHPSAVIHTSAILSKNVKIGPFCYIGKDVSIGEGSILYPNVSIFDNSLIGNNCVFWSGTVIRENSIIGNSCIFHNNVSIGADGFGYRPSPEGKGLVKIHHIGNVVIGNNVEIGANTCVDKATFDSTVIGDGCKIDNLVQIAHNSVMGKYCLMAGNSGLAGSVTLGDGVMIGGSASVKEHTKIGSGASVGAGSGVISDVAQGTTVLGYPAAEYREMLKQWVAIKKLVKN